MKTNSKSNSKKSNSKSNSKKSNSKLYSVNHPELYLKISI